MFLPQLFFCQLFDQLNLAENRIIIYIPALVVSAVKAYCVLKFIGQITPIDFGSHCNCHKTILCQSCLSALILAQQRIVLSRRPVYIVRLYR